MDLRRSGSTITGFIVLIASLTSGCVSNPGVTKLSPDTYLIFREDKGGIFGNAEAMKLSVIKDADDFAETQGKVAIPVASKETPMFPGHFATFEYQFRVVDPSDPEAKRTSLVPRPDVVIEKKESITADVNSRDDKAPDLYTQLLKLDDLRKRGLLTDAEFEAQKAKLLEGSK
jgi:hypothetical protein